LRYFRICYQVYADRTPEIRHKACDESMSESKKKKHRKACDVLDDLSLAKGDALSCGLARLHGFIGGKPIQVTVSHGPGIEPCRCSGNTVLDA
jgi:hypothetical protein